MTGDRKQGTGDRGQGRPNVEWWILKVEWVVRSDVRRQTSEEGFARAAFCSGTPPRSDRGCGGLRGPLPIGAGSRAATKRRMPRRQTPNPKSAIPNPQFFPAPVGAGSRAATKRRMHRRAEAESTNPRFSPPSRAVRAPDLAHGQAPARCHGHPCPWEFPGDAGFQARRPSRKPLASPCACPLRGVAFCSGTPPRSDRGCGGLRGPLPSAREAAPLQKGGCRAAR